MSGTAVAAWTVVAVLGVTTPGIDTLLVLRNALLGGRRRALAAVGGIAVGSATWAVASLAGLTALLQASELAYDVVRLVGAVYLVWLGCSALWRTLPGRRRDDGGHGGVSPATGSVRASAAFRTGLVTNLLNPKVGVFYVSVLPQFLPTGPGQLGWGLVLVAIHLLVTWTWYPLVVLFAVRARRALMRERVRRWMDRVTAGVLIGLGVRLATDSR